MDATMSSLAESAVEVVAEVDLTPLLEKLDYVLGAQLLGIGFFIAGVWVLLMALKWR